MALLLVCMSVGAQVPEVSISGYCYQNKKTIDLRSSGENNGHTWVNLGFGSLWATVNVGAENPEDYGNFYAWGETAPKDEYSWTTYKYCNGSCNTMTKYCTDNDYGTVDNKVFLDIEDDAAHVNWQGDWQLPSRADLEELYKQCTWVDTTLNGVKVYKAIGPNGNYIYLPKTGWYANNQCLFKGERISYWAAELYLCKDSYRLPYISDCGFSLDFASPGEENPGCGARRLGCPVRPVCKSTTVSSSDCILTLYAGGCDEPNYVYCAKGQQVSISAIAIEENWMHFARWSDGNTDMPRLLTVDQNITLTAIYEKDYTIGVKGEHGGSFIIAGKRYKPGEVAVMEFIPDLGYHFVRWDDGSTENPRRVVMTQDTIIYGYAEMNYDGQCGENLYWKYADSTLTITGTGRMTDYLSYQVPWRLLRDSITKVVLPEGLVSIGAYAFNKFQNLPTVTVPSTVTSLEESSFSDCDQLVDFYCLAPVPPVVAHLCAIGEYDAYLHVPCDYIEAYKQDSLFGHFAHIVCQGIETAIDEVSSSSSSSSSSSQQSNLPSSKFIRKGNLYVMCDGKTYTAQGALVE